MQISKVKEEPRIHPLGRHRPSFCGLPLSAGMTAESVVKRALSTSGGQPILTTFVNPGAIYILRRNPEYGAMLKAFDMVLPDGIGIVWGWRATHGNCLSRLSFDSSSLALPVFRKARDDGRTVMLIGGRPGVANIAAAELAKAIPGLQICRSYHGYCDVSVYEAAVRAERPDVVICGMGAPRQEALLLMLRESGSLSGPAFTCGGYLDQLRGGLQYYPPLIDRSNLRWLYRLYCEPHRLWHRYLIEYPEYAIALAHEWYCMWSAQYAKFEESV